MASILIVDDHEIVRKGIYSLVNSHPDVDKIFEREGGNEAYQFLQSTSVDLIILDINLKGVSGIETLRKIILKYPKQKVLMLSMHDNPVIVQQAMNAGACGYICKSEFAESLNNAIGTILENKIFISDLTLKQLKEYELDDQTNLKVLTAREFEVFQFVTNGKTNEETSVELNISPKTVANKIAIIKDKLGVTSDFELFYAAQKQGLVKDGK